MQLIFEKSRVGRIGFQLPETDVPKSAALPVKYRRQTDAQLPEVSELDLEPLDSARYSTLHS